MGESHESQALWQEFAIVWQSSATLWQEFATLWQKFAIRVRGTKTPFSTFRRHQFTTDFSNRRFVRAELRTSVLSVVRAAYISGYHGGHGGHGGFSNRRFVRGELRTSMFSVVCAAYIWFTTEDTEGTEDSRTGGLCGPNCVPPCSPWSAQRTFQVTTEDTEGTEDSRTGGSCGPSSVPPCSPWSAQRTFGLPRRTRRARRILEPEVHSGRTPYLRVLRGPRSVHLIYHGGHGGRGGF